MYWNISNYWYSQEKRAATFVFKSSEFLNITVTTDYQNTKFGYFMPKIYLTLKNSCSESLCVKSRHFKQNIVSCQLIATLKCSVGLQCTITDIIYLNCRKNKKLISQLLELSVQLQWSVMSSNNCLLTIWKQENIKFHIKLEFLPVLYCKKHSPMTTGKIFTSNNCNKPLPV